MKNALTILAVALLFSSCLKEANKPATTIKTTETAVTDSVSVNVDGKFYTYTDIGVVGNGNREANKKLDSIDKDLTRHFSSDPDSLLFDHDIIVDGGNSFIKFSFFKKYAKNDLIANNGILGIGVLSPKNDDQLFAVGTYNFPVDYDQTNTHNGVAIEVTTDKYMTSFDQTFAGYPSPVSSNAQDNAFFKITSVKKQRGGYLIEANFALNLFEQDGTQHKVNNGYLRLFVE